MSAFLSRLQFASVYSYSISFFRINSQKQESISCPNHLYYVLRVRTITLLPDILTVIRTLV